MKFTKMHGNGNDYVCVDCLEEPLADPKGTARFASNRHFGIGADGLLLILPSKRADVKMEMYNADGSLGAMCGNGIRCVGKYVYERGIVRRPTIRVETAAGIRELSLKINNGKVLEIQVEMGRPTMESINKRLFIEETLFLITSISMGNPHAVLFVDDIQRVDVARMGERIAASSAFPEGTNVEFVRVIDRHTIEMRVYERGVGETLSCGTGACAAAVACMTRRLTADEAAVKSPGGTLHIRWEKESGIVYLKGSASEVFSGDIEVKRGEENRDGSDQ